MNIWIIGGDTRMTYVADSFRQNGAEVLLLTPQELSEQNSLRPSSGDILLLPLPVTRDGITLAGSQESGAPFLLSPWLETLPTDVLILGGQIPRELSARMAELHLRFADYAKSPYFLRQNGRLTAEGALVRAMDRSKTAMCERHALILGGGHIAKPLLQMLLALGAKVTLCARNTHDLRWAESLGAVPVDLYGDSQKVEDAMADAELVFNTVPEVTLWEDAITQRTEPWLYVELAGKASFLPNVREMQGEKGKALPCLPEVLCLPSLPARYAPKSAGHCVYGAICEVLEHLREEELL